MATYTVLSFKNYVLNNSKMASCYMPPVLPDIQKISKYSNVFLV